ncbi:MAG: hypothetical protein P8R42_28935 [Candidatus Binatia bacterium]|nr:hypothetical protein [Candidatus Binatia bacterium]
MTKGMQTLASLALAVALTGCPGNAAEEMLDTAQLEEVQDNPKNARKIYSDIIQRYPDSPQADTARARLAALEE